MVDLAGARAGENSGLVRLEGRGGGDGDGDRDGVDAAVQLLLVVELLVCRELDNRGAGLLAGAVAASVGVRGLVARSAVLLEVGQSPLRPATVAALQNTVHNTTK